MISIYVPIAEIEQSNGKGFHKLIWLSTILKLKAANDEYLPHLAAAQSRIEYPRDQGTQQERQQRLHLECPKSNCALLKLHDQCTY